MGKKNYKLFSGMNDRLGFDFMCSFFLYENTLLRMLNVHKIGIIGQFVCIFRNAFSIFMCIQCRHYLYFYDFVIFANAYMNLLLMLHTFEWCHLQFLWKSKAVIKLKLIQRKKHKIIGNELVGLRFTICCMDCSMWYRIWIVIILLNGSFFNNRISFFLSP